MSAAEIAPELRAELERARARGLKIWCRLHRDRADGIIRDCVAVGRVERVGDRGFVLIGRRWERFILLAEVETVREVVANEGRDRR